MPIIAVTGHRPDKLKCGYRIDPLVKFASKALLDCGRPIHVITGMALGWDTAIAWACHLNKIPWTAAIPFEGQELRWSEKDQHDYKWLISRATEKHIICQGPYSPDKMQIRNIWMIDKLIPPDDFLLALHNGSPGGTSNCIKYANKTGVAILNIWDLWDNNAL